MNLRDEIDEAFEEFLLDTKYYLGGMYELPVVIVKYVKNTIKEKKNQKKQSSSKKRLSPEQGLFLFRINYKYYNERTRKEDNYVQKQNTRRDYEGA